MKEREYHLLEAISQDSTVTQAGLAARLGIAVGSVNWYIKRLINRGYIKVTRMDRTRLKYNLTTEGMAALTKRASQYIKDSLVVYRDLRQAAKRTIDELSSLNVSHIFLEGDDELMDIMRLTCIEAGIRLDEEPQTWVIVHDDRGYKVLKTTDDC